MGVKLLDPLVPEPWLRVRDHVLFVGNWPERWKPFNPLDDSSKVKTFWEVQKTQQIQKENIAILGQGGGSAVNVWDLVLDDVNGFQPRGSRTLYEIRTSFHGDALLYIIWPTPSTYFYQLENPAFIPDLSSDTNRYVGFFKSSDLGSEEKPSERGCR